MRRDGHVVRLGHGGDLLQLQDAAGVRHVGIDDIGGPLLEDLSESGLAVERFARDDRY